MKQTTLSVSILFLLAILVVGASSSHSHHEAALGICPNNPFISSLRAKGLKTFTRPVKNHEFCGAEWGNHGTCCDADSLKKLVENEDKNTDYLQAFMTAEIRSAFNAMRDFYVRHGFRTRDRKFKNLFKKKSKRKDAVKDKLDKEIYGTMKQIVKKFRRTKRLMITSQKKCLKKLHEVRSGSHCFTCSSRSNMFFDEKSRMRIHENTCREIVSECTESWLLLIKLVNYMTKFREFTLRVEQAYHIPKKFRQHIPQLEGIASFLTETKVQEKLKNCKNSHSSQCSFDSVKSVCDTFVSINGPLYLEVALKHFPNSAKFKFAKLGVNIKRAFNKAGQKFKGAFQKAGHKIKNAFKNFGSKFKGLFKRKSKKGRKLATSGRLLLLKKAPTATPASTNINVATQAVLSSAASTNPNQATAANPLLCSTSTCPVDKVIMTVSQCGSLLLQNDARCTTSMSFP